MVWGLVFKRLRSFDVSAINWLRCCSLFCNSFNLHLRAKSDGISFGSKKNIQIKKKLPVKRYLFLSLPKPLQRRGLEDTVFSIIFSIPELLKSSLQEDFR